MTVKELLKECDFSYFLKDVFTECFLLNYSKLKYVVEYELIPLLKEYWFDEQEKIEYWSSKLRSVINDI